MLLGLAVVPVWGWRRTRRRPVRRLERLTPLTIAASGTTSSIGIPPMLEWMACDIIL
jgi:hypothetical protein